MSRTEDRMHRRLLGVVLAILAATLVGMVALWPGADDLPDVDPFAAGDPTVTGVVRSIDAFEGEPDPFVGTDGTMLRIDVEIVDGPDAGHVVELELDPTGYPEFSEGDRLVVTPRTGPDGEREFYLSDFQRIPALTWLVGLFVLAVLVIGRWHGLRSLLGLALSLLIVVRFIVPAILAGQNPPLVALVGALAIMIATLYLTHGVNEMTTAAVIGTAAALTLTIGLALVFISQASISGFTSDDAVYARFAVGGDLDLRGLVLAGLIIAALGVLDDVTVSQSSTVFALHDTDRTLAWGALFARAMRVGRDHIASVVNTLFLAYAGASLALLVLFSIGGGEVMEIVNSEVFAEELVKIIVGSLGLIAAVPFTTALAAAVAIRRSPDAAPMGGGHLHGQGAAAAVTGASARQRSDGAPARRRRSGSAAGAAGRPGSSNAPGATEHASDVEDPDDLDDDERAHRAWMRYLERNPAPTDEAPGRGDAPDGTPGGPAGPRPG